MKLKNLFESITLYRGITSKNLPKRYPGKFYTELESLAYKYAKDGGSVSSITFEPKSTLFLDKIKSDNVFHKTLFTEFKNFMEKNYPNVDIQTTQLYDNFTDSNITDFSYPTKYDNDFLSYKGYDSVFFSKEGGTTVNSWYIPD